MTTLGLLARANGFTRFVCQSHVAVLFLFSQLTKIDNVDSARVAVANDVPIAPHQFVLLLACVREGKACFGHRMTLSSFATCAESAEEICEALAAFIGENAAGDLKSMTESRVLSDRK